MTLKISMDIDGCLADFYGEYNKRFGTPKNDKTITKHVQGILKSDKDFWLNLPVLNNLDWNPKQYTTARIIPKKWIKEYLSKELFPKAPIYQIYGYGLSKYRMIKKGGCHLHIDDSLSVYQDLTRRGFPCLLLDTPHNQHFQTKARIYSLTYKEIEETYNRLWQA